MSLPASSSGRFTSDPAQIVLNTIRHPVIMVSPDGYISFANADAESFFRSSSAILARNKLDSFIPFGSPLLELIEQVRERRAAVHPMCAPQP